MEIQGEWWLPEVPDEKLQGTLVIEEGKINLALFGKLSHPIADPMPMLLDGEQVPKPGTEATGEPGIYPRIHGDDGTKAYTLEDCFQIDRTGIFGGLVTQRVTVHQVYQGAWFPTDQELEFTDITVELLGLPEFVQRSGTSEAPQYSKPLGGGHRLDKTTIHLEPVPPIEFAGLDGADGKFIYRWGRGRIAFRQQSITETFALRMTYDDFQPVKSLLRACGYVQDLVSVATGRRAAFTKVELTRPDLQMRYGSSKDEKGTVTLYANWVVKPEPNRSPLQSSDVLFNLDEFGGDRTMSEWLAVADTYAAALNRVMISRYSDAVYPSDLLLNAVAALEGYHRDRFEGGRRTDTHLLHRVAECITYAGPVFDDLVADTNTFAKLLKNGRHAVAHHLDGMEAPAQHLFLSRSAAWLLVLCLLRDANVPSIVFDRVKENPDWWWLRDHTKKVLDDAVAGK